MAIDSEHGGGEFLCHWEETQALFNTWIGDLSGVVQGIKYGEAMRAEQTMMNGTWSNFVSFGHELPLFTMFRQEWRRVP